MRLNDKAIKAAKPAERPYKLGDGAGLHLQVNPNGGRWWRFRYRYAGRERMISLGTYPATPLKAARHKRDECRRLLECDPPVDPSAHRQAQKAAQADSFKIVAEEFLSQSDAADSTIAKTRRRLEMYIYPTLGNAPIVSIDAPTLLRALRRAESKGSPETAQRIRQACSQIFRFAVASGKAGHDPAADLRDALKAVETKGLAAITEPKAVGKLMRDVSNYSGSPVTAAALELLALTLTRPGELRQARWEEFDLEAGTWIVPASRMKSRRRTPHPHAVPLSTQAVEILQQLREQTGDGDLVFPTNRPGRPLSENALSYALKRLGYQGKQTAHGFRKTGSTILHSLGFDSDVIEKQLAHVVPGVRGIYNLHAYAEERTVLMQAYADHLAMLRDGEDKVVPLKGAVNE